MYRLKMLTTRCSTTVGGLGLQVSGISIMRSIHVFKAMALANTPCPIVEVTTGKLLIGREAYMKMRSKPEIYIVGYNQDKTFGKLAIHWKKSLMHLKKILLPVLLVTSSERK